MKNNNIQDERILLQRRRIQSDAYQILIYCLLISIIIQQFILKVPFSQFAVEFFCITGMGLYMIIRHLTSGIDIWNSTQSNIKKLLINGVITGIISLVLIIVLAGERDIWNLIIFFISFMSFYIIANLAFQHINKKRQNQIDAKLNKDD